MKRSIRISGLAAALLLASGASVAAGLGKLSVMSSLGQPLRAEIELLSVPVDDLGAVQATLAGPEAYRQARIERSQAIEGVRLTVDKRSDGQPVVRIVSAAPVSTPFVDLLIELNWNSGRILREYTVLLDPVRDPAAAPVRQPPVLATVVEPAKPAQAKPAASEPATKTPAPARAEPAEAKTAQPRTYGPVKSGETLRSIAAKVLPPDVTLEMMVASLYQANPDAFMHDNMNLLRRGQVLNVPERNAVMTSFSPSQARQLMGKHAAAWHEMQGRVAGQAARTPAEPMADEGAAGKGRIVQAKPKAEAPAAASQQDVLKLSKGEPAKAEDAKAGQRIGALEEEIAAKNRALQEAQARISQLEKTVQDLQRLMQLKSKEPAPAQDAAPAAPQPPAPVQPEKPAEPPPLIGPSEEPGFLASLLASPLYLAGAVAAILLAILLWVFVAGSRRRKRLSDFEQSVMTGGDQFKTSIFKTGTGPGTERGATTQSGVATDFSRLGLGSIDTHEVDPIAEAEVYMAYGRDAQAEEILKEALAKDPERHEIVLKLLEIYATRRDTAAFETQASELYANLGDPASPVWRQAAEMGRNIDPGNPLYRVFGEIPDLPEETAAAEAGPEPEPVEPESEAREEPVAEDMEPMAEPAVDDLGDLEFDMTAETAPEAEPADMAGEMAEEPMARADEALTESLPEMEPVPEAEESLEFDMPEAAPEPEPLPEWNEPAPVEPAAEASLDLDIPLELPEMEVEPETRPAESTRSESKEAEALPELGDLSDIELPEAESAADMGDGELGEQSATLPDLDFSGIDLDLNEEPVEEIVAQPVAEEESPVEAEEAVEIDPDLLEEVNTKLDLARAYMEMGDKEGAREILDEVAKEGDSQQRQEAERLIASL